MTWLGSGQRQQHQSPDPLINQHVSESGAIQQQTCRQTISSQAAPGGKFRGRYSAMRSLELLRLNLQNLINKEIDIILKKYISKFFEPAIANIEKNVGAGCVSEENVRAVCIQMLEDAKTQYYLSSSSSSRGNSPFSDIDLQDPRQRIHLQNGIDSILKRKDLQGDSCEMWNKNRKKVLRTVTSILPGAPTPIRSVKLDSIRRDGPKWDPDRITKHTLFIMGARANKVLGFGQTRGRLYTKHPEILKYSGDTEDKEWLSRNNLMPPTGGIAYLLLLEDIRELAESEDYRRNPNVLLHELKGFEAPDFMLIKIKKFISEVRTDNSFAWSWQAQPFDVPSSSRHDGEAPTMMMPPEKTMTATSHQSSVVPMDPHRQHSQMSAVVSDNITFVQRQSASSSVATSSHRAYPSSSGTRADNIAAYLKSVSFPEPSTKAYVRPVNGDISCTPLMRTGAAAHNSLNRCHPQSVVSAGCQSSVEVNSSQPQKEFIQNYETSSESIIERALLMSMGKYPSVSSTVLPNIGL